MAPNKKNLIVSCCKLGCPDSSADNTKYHDSFTQNIELGPRNCWKHPYMLTQKTCTGRRDADAIVQTILDHIPTCPRQVFAATQSNQPLGTACIHMPSFGATVTLATSAAITPAAPPICDAIIQFSSTPIASLLVDRMGVLALQCRLWSLSKCCTVVGGLGQRRDDTRLVPLK